MSEERDHTLLQVAGAISDGIRIDWEREKEAHPGLEETLGRLRLVEAIMRVHQDPEKTRAVSGPSRGVPSSWGPLRIVERIGEGGFGTVYRAHDPTLQRDVALKLLRETAGGGAPAAARFLAEARRQARVRHPNVLTIYGADEHDGRVGIWTDLLRGKTLEAHLVEQGPMSAHEAALVGLDLCRALAAVHAAGLVHRDVKTQNVMREEGGRIVLMDFGSVHERPVAGAIDVTKNIEGTPIAMAPEQLRGDIAGPATDIYGLGVLLYRLVTGSYPIEATSMDELTQKHLRQESVPLRDRRADLPAAFVHVVERALDPDAARRHQSAGAMERELAAALGTPSAVAPAQALAAPAGTGQADEVASVAGPRRRLSLLLVVTMAVLVVVAITMTLRGRRETDRSRSVADRSTNSAPREALPSDIPSSPDAGTASAGPLTAAATVYRSTAKGETRLLPGARVAPGDRLSMTIEGTDDMYVYVLNEDEAGRSYVLFPIPGLSLRNPLAPHATHRLPGALADSAVRWTVTSAGGRESIVVIASRAPLPDLERDIARIPRATPGRPVSFGRVSTEAVETLRGIGGLSAGSTGRSGGRLSEALRDLSKATDRSVDLWTWEIQLENPGR